MIAKTSQNPRHEAIKLAREFLSKNPVYLDTETTGLTRSDEIVEISIVDDQGNQVYSSLVKPSQPISPEAAAVHGISNLEVQTAPAWPIIWPTLRTHLVANFIGIYNAEFDLRLMQQSHARYRLPWKENLKSFCIMRLYSQFIGEWDHAHHGYRYFSLDKAGKDSHISIPNAHRATADSLLARALLHFIAESEIRN